MDKLLQTCQACCTQTNMSACVYFDVAMATHWVPVLCRAEMIIRKTFLHFAHFASCLDYTCFSWSSVTAKSIAAYLTSVSSSASCGSRDALAFTVCAWIFQQVEQIAVGRHDVIKYKVFITDLLEVRYII